MNAKTFTVESPGGTFPAHGRLPRQCRAPGLLFFHGSDGFGPHHARFAEELARAGFAVLAPVWFGAGSPYVRWDGVTRADVAAFWEFLGKIEGVNPARRGLLGASRGGGVALLAATFLDGVRAVGNLYGHSRWEGSWGLGESARLGVGGEAEWGYAERIRAPVISFHGEADAVVEAAETLALDAALRRHGLPHELHLYPGVDHSFLWTGNPKHNETAHRRCVAELLAFFQRTMA